MLLRLDSYRSAIMEVNPLCCRGRAVRDMLLKISVTNMLSVNSTVLYLEQVEI